MEIRLEHGLGQETAAERVRGAAERFGLTLGEGGDAHSGTVQKETPFGLLRGTWQALEAEVVVDIDLSSSLVPEALIRRPLEDGLGEALKS